jgi:hypothetical protein
MAIHAARTLRLAESEMPLNAEGVLPSSKAVAANAFSYAATSFRLAIIAWRFFSAAA